MNSLRAFSAALFLVIVGVTSNLAQPTEVDAMPFDSGRKFDEYGVLSFKREKAHLNNLAIQLGKEPNSKSYIIVYKGSADHVVNLKERMCRALQYLIANRGVNPKQVVGAVVNGGNRKKFTVELWMWPLDTTDDLPRFQDGLSEKEVSIIKGVEAKNRCRTDVRQGASRRTLHRLRTHQ